MEKRRACLLGITCGMAAFHAAFYVVQGGADADQVQVSQGMGRLILVGLLGAASLTYELALRAAAQRGETQAAPRRRPDLLIPALWLLAATLYALTAWPTMYRAWWGEDGYDYRTNRVTGATQWRCHTRWKPVTPGTTLVRPYRQYP